MNRWLLVTLVLSLGADGACPMDDFAYHAAGTASAATGDVEILRAYIDPGVAGFVIVTVLGFISSVGYMAREYLGRAKRRLFGPGETTTDVGADGEASADGSDDDEREHC